ncbi:MAG: DNA translocase FtsK 4TM domain-containing protein [Bacteroidetes bacterium]|nr:DNA translocase FtsK 4TM domain-containing protein [Bacteroidota bacterium]
MIPNLKKKNPTTAPKEKKVKKSSPSSKGKNKRNYSRQFGIIAGILLMLVSVFLLLSFISYCAGAWKSDDIFRDPNIGIRDVLFNNSLVIQNYMGRIGAALAFIFIKRWFGLGSFLFVLVFFVAGFRLTFKRRLLPFGKTFFISIILIAITSVSAGYITSNTDYSFFGGLFGLLANNWLEGLLGRLGAGLLLGFLVFSLLILLLNITFSRKKKVELPEPVPDVIPPLETSGEPVVEKPEATSVFEFEMKNEEEPVREEQKKEAPVAGKKGKTDEKEGFFTVETKKETEETEQDDEEEADNEYGSLKTLYDPTKELSNYKLPPLDLLLNYGSNAVSVNKEELEENKNKIVKTLNNYSISIDKIIATIGPTVTLYEIVPAPGIRISKIKNLEDDIALSLSAYGIRIIAPIPGKGTIGIEVPNQNPEIVAMRSVLSSDKFQNSKYELPIALGKTISNETFVADLTKFPHLLMAGATGQGKSVGLNAIITSILYRKHPSEVKFVMVDPKKVELSLFAKIENHYLAKLPDFDEAIITDTRKVVRVLNSMMIEMDNRYNLLKDAQVRNIKEYNTKFIARKLNPEKGHQFLPYIVLVVDEFADLIMTAGKEIETPLTRLAQLSRAIGIHLIIATQRPSVNIITGTIKANFPARVAFRVISKIDSRTILDSGGADQLVGRGDMLLSMGSDMIRLQCAFIDTGEIDTITEFIGSQHGFPHPFHLPEYYEEGEGNGKEMDMEDRDDMFEEAARLIVQYQQGSTSLIQRKMKLGYNRAGRIMDQLEAAGIVGPPDGSKPREVKIRDMHTLEQFLKDGFL